MPENTHIILSGVAETLLIPLYIRSMESQRPDAMIKDQKAEELVQKISDDGLYDFNRINLLQLTEANNLVIVLRNRQFDRFTLNFLSSHPGAIVVHIGCGFDTRYERVDNGQVEWYDLDLPGVIDLRRELFGDEGYRHHLIGCSVLQETWLEAVSEYGDRPFLFLAEGVSMHLTGEQIKSLIQMLLNHFPGAELVFDAFSPIHNWVSNRQTSRFGFQTHWGIWSGKQIEKWGDGIHFLGEWSYVNETDARLAPLHRLRMFETIFRTIRIYHFQVGDVAS
jgi:O-methyltransferase involved in polyketide biosynthesis